MRDIYFYEDINVLRNKLNIKNESDLEKAEADFISSRIVELEYNEIEEDISLNFFKLIHFKLFQDIYEWAGEFRKINIEKYERVLHGLSIKYEGFENIESKMNEIFEYIKNMQIKDMSKDELLDYIVDISVKLWKVHPFREGNTRIVILFIFKYLQRNEIKIDKELFYKNSKYVRDAFVAASFEDDELEIKANKGYLEKIVKAALEKS